MTQPLAPTPAGDADDRAVRTSVDVAASPERVFEALTDPRALEAWWGGDAGRTRDWEVDAHPGGRLRLRATGPDGREGAVEGEYLVVDAPRRLEHTWHPSWDHAPSIVRFDLAPADVGGVPGTRVTVTHTLGISATLRAAAPRPSPVALARLATLAALGPARAPRLSPRCDPPRAPLPRTIQPWCGERRDVAWAARPRAMAVR